MGRRDRNPSSVGWASVGSRSVTDTGTEKKKCHVLSWLLLHLWLFAATAAVSGNRDACPEASQVPIR